MTNTINTANTTKPYQGILRISKILCDGADIVVSGYFNTASGKGQIVLNRARIKNADTIPHEKLGNTVYVYTDDTSFIPSAYKA